MTRAVLSATFAVMISFAGWRLLRLVTSNEVMSWLGMFPGMFVGPWLTWTKPVRWIIGRPKVYVMPDLHSRPWLAFGIAASLPLLWSIVRPDWVEPMGLLSMMGVASFSGSIAAGVGLFWSDKV